jgi:RNA polymerase sigma-70 factor (ECF subfamily)
MQGMTHQEASDVLGWPLGTVKTHLLRGKEILRNKLAEWSKGG